MIKKFDNQCIGRNPNGDALIETLSGQATLAYPSVQEEAIFVPILKAMPYI